MNNEKYKEHEFGVEAPEGYLLESSEDYLEELNQLLKERDEARQEASRMRDMINSQVDASFPWEKKN